MSEALEPQATMNDENAGSVTTEEPMVDVQVNGTRVTLLGTAHISKASADKVAELLQSGDYDSVAVELCYSRYRSMVDPDAIAKMDLFEVIKEGKATMVAASLALGAFQQRMAEKLDIKPGAEMRAAIDIADNKDLNLLLIDREIGTTLKRVYRSVGFWHRLNLIAGLLISVITRQDVREEEIERLKEGDILESTFTQFAEEAKELYVPLVDERDRYMAARILQEIRKGEKEGTEAKEKLNNLLVVIGAGHLNGIQRYLESWDQLGEEELIHAKGFSIQSVDGDSGNNESRERTVVTAAAANDPKQTDSAKGMDPGEVVKALNFIPEGSRWPKTIPWVIVALIAVGFIIGFYRSPEMGWQLVMDWVLINGVLCALGALVAAAHPFTIIGAFIAAPITSLNPTIGAGMVTAAIETVFRKPKVEDFSHLRSDSTRIGGWWSNRVTRVLLVFIFCTLGSAAGTYLAGYKIVERLTVG